MGEEIERKFLVRGDFKSNAFRATRIVQGYISSQPGRTVRIRMNDETGYITIKGAGREGGVSRFEWEREIPLDEARELLALCEPGVIDKMRYFVAVGNHTYEVDEFFGDNSGLVIAEIELKAENEFFVKPDWLGPEVTGEMKYYNAMLVRHPYRMWE